MGPPLFLLTETISTCLSALYGIFSGKLLAPHVPFAMPFNTRGKQRSSTYRKPLPPCAEAPSLQLGFAFPLLVPFTATISSRLRFLDVQAAGEAITFCGRVLRCIESACGFGFGGLGARRT